MDQFSHAYEFAIRDDARKIWISFLAPDEYTLECWRNVLTKLCSVDEQQGHSIFNDTTKESILFVDEPSFSFPSESMFSDKPHTLTSSFSVNYCGTLHIEKICNGRTVLYEADLDISMQDMIATIAYNDE